MRRCSYLFFLLLLLLFGCPQDRGETLFEIIYEPINFTLTPGQPSFEARVLSRANHPTRFTSTLQSSNVSLDQVDEISGLFARITSLSGEDFSELRSIDLRVCPVDQSACTDFDVLFSVNDLFRRRDISVNLNPGLRNFIDVFQEDVVRMEWVFVSGQSTTQSIDCRLEWSVRGVSR